MITNTYLCYNVLFIKMLFSELIITANSLFIKILTKDTKTLNDQKEVFL